MQIRFCLVLAFAFAACGNNNTQSDAAVPDLYGADLSYPPDLTGQGVLDLASACGPAGSPCQTSTGTNGLCDGMSGCLACNDTIDDAACNAAYGSAGDPYQCVNNHCQKGQCHDSGGCPAGQICAGAYCSACTGATVATSDTACQTDAAYGAGFICDTGLCVPGNCHSDADCVIGAGTGICGLMTAHTCQPCAQDTDCSGDLDNSGSGGPGTMCKVSTGECVQNSCTKGSGACSDNPSDFCCGPSGSGNATCQPGNCCGTCATGVCSELGGTVAGVCGSCAAPTDPATVYVDPVNGSDMSGTGSNVNAAGGGSCAFATVTRAIQAFGHPVSPVTVVVLGDPGTSLRVSPLSPREQMPINIPANVTVQANTGPINFVTLNGFLFSGGASGLQGFNITSSSTGNGNGINVGFPVAGQVSLTNVTVSGFQTGLTFKQPTTTVLNAGVQINNNGTAARPGDGIMGDGILRINGQTASPPVQVNANSRYGIQVIGQGSVDFSGDATVPTVTLNGNGLAGIYLNQVPNTGSNSINGVVANNTVAGPGLLVHGGLTLKLRSSKFLGNVDGVQVTPNGSGSGANNDVSKLDLGQAASGSARGANTLQDAFGGNPNSGAGICLGIALTQTGIAGTLLSEGNIFSGPRDCSQLTPGTLKKSADCTGGVDVSVLNPGGASTQVAIKTDNCN
jgi:hypothetical protein